MEFPDTLQGFNYSFSEDGRLLHTETGEPFQFVVKENDHSFNQKHYEALGEVITSHVYQLLEERCGLQRLPVPVDGEDGEPETFIFASKNYDKVDKLLVLIHGTGVVRAGQWARRLIINDCLNSGTQIPFIKRGVEEGYGILVMNTNDNSRFQNGENVPIRGSKSAESHGKYVWENYIRKCQAEKIAIIAHSYGGIVTTQLFKEYKEEFIKRVFAIAMTDSIHFFVSGISGLTKISRNWVTSHLPLDSPINKKSKDIPCVSAGCLQHEMTSWSSFDSIFKFLYDKLLPVEELSKPSYKLSTENFNVPNLIESPNKESSASKSEDKTSENPIPEAPTVDVSLSGESNTEKNEPVEESTDEPERVSGKTSSGHTDETENLLEGSLKKLKCDKSL